MVKSRENVDFNCAGYDTSYHWLVTNDIVCDNGIIPAGIYIRAVHIYDNSKKNVDLVERFIGQLRYNYDETISKQLKSHIKRRNAYTVSMVLFGDKSKVYKKVFNKRDYVFNYLVLADNLNKLQADLNNEIMNFNNRTEDENMSFIRAGICWFCFTGLGILATKGLIHYILKVSCVGIVSFVVGRFVLDYIKPVLKNRFNIDLYKQPDTVEYVCLVDELNKLVGGSYSNKIVEFSHQ